MGLGNLRHYFDRYRNFAASLDQIRPLFISEEAAFELIAQTEKVMARGKNLATMSDFQIRRMEEEEYRLSGIIHQLELIRMGLRWQRQYRSCGTPANGT